MRARDGFLAGLVLACLALAAPASAAVHTGVDHLNRVRLTLDGRTLTAALADPSRSTETWGRRVRAGCVTNVFQPRGSRYTSTVATWPTGATSFTFTLPRDLSRRARVCWLEAPDGGDIAVVRFERGERYRLLAKGRSHAGGPWRLSGRAGLALEPCVKVLVGGSHLQACLTIELVRDVRMLVAVEQPDCTDDTFVYGMAPSTTASVEVRLADGTTVDASLHGPPRGSRARARWFIAPIAGSVQVESVVARDSSGATVGRKRPHSSVC
jgi:hypothetical protein